MAVNNPFATYYYRCCQRRGFLITYPNCGELVFGLFIMIMINES